jgi:hypothetical protein
MASEVSASIADLGNRPYKRDTDMFHTSVLRHCIQGLGLFIRPTKKTMFAPSSTAPSILRDGEMMDFYRDQGPLGLYTSREIPHNTILFTIKLNDKTDNQLERDVVNVHSSLELVALLNQSCSALSSKKRKAEFDICAAMHDYTYMGVKRPPGAPSAASMVVPKHIHQFIAFPHTGTLDDLRADALAHHKWFDMGNTAAVFVNGLETNFNCEFDVLCKAAVRCSSGKAVSGIPDRIVLRSLDMTITAWSELTVEY